MWEPLIDSGGAGNRDYGQPKHAEKKNLLMISVFDDWLIKYVHCTIC